MYTLEEWLETDRERVLDELSSLLEILGVRIGNMADLRKCVDDMRSK